MNYSPSTSTSSTNFEDQIIDYNSLVIIEKHDENIDLIKILIQNLYGLIGFSTREKIQKVLESTNPLLCISSCKSNVYFHDSKQALVFMVHFTTEI